MKLARKLLILGTVLVFTTIYHLGSNLSISRTDPLTIPSMTGPLFDESLFQAGLPKPAPHNHTLTIVTGHLTSEDVSWLSYFDESTHISTAIYEINITDTDSTTNTLPANKGHEAMVYLTYIINHYTTLPDVVIFIHPHRWGWHNNILNDVDMRTSISRLSLPHVIRQGYFNTRCHLDPGCPNWHHVDRPWLQWDRVRKPEEPYLTSSVFAELHGARTQVPQSISQPCCAQFAVSGERIRSRSLGFYERYRQWILDTDLKDDTSGRLLEYSWQFMFTGLWEWCPSMRDCYCQGYGVCFEGGNNAGDDNPKTDTIQKDGLVEWLRILKTKEKIDQKMQRYREKGVTDTKKWDKVIEESNRVGEVLNRLKGEALRRGREMRIREGER